MKIDQWEGQNRDMAESAPPTSQYIKGVLYPKLLGLIVIHEIFNHFDILSGFRGLYR